MKTHFFFSGTVYYNHTHGCMRCTVTGEWSRENRTMVFPKLNAPKRTDEDFRNLIYLNGHQKFVSPILELPIDVIQDFPVGDSLHLLDAGITKKLLIGWIEGRFVNVHAKWCRRQFELISDFIGSIKAPKEIRALRAVRDLKCIHNWKSIEFRNFGLYIGLVVLKNNIRSDIYSHFVLYYCILTIYSSKYHLKYFSTVGDSCLKLFVERFKIIYGNNSFSSNVHNLVHLPDDVCRFGVLNTFNTYPFESKLYTIRRLLRTGNLPLSQAAKRIIEQESLPNIDEQPLSAPILKKKVSTKFDELNVLLSVNYDVFLFAEFPLLTIDCTRDEDQWVLTHTNQIVKVLYIVCCDNDSILLYGQALTDTADFFETPIRSSKMLLFSSKNLMKGVLSIFPNKIKCKLFKVQRKAEFIYADNEADDIGEFVFLPIISTINSL